MDSFIYYLQQDGNQSHLTEKPIFNFKSCGRLHANLPTLPDHFKFSQQFQVFSKRRKTKKRMKSNFGRRRGKKLYRNRKKQIVTCIVSSSIWSKSAAFPRPDPTAAGVVP